MKSSMQHYDAPDFKIITGLSAENTLQSTNADANTYEKPSFLERMNIFTDAFAY